MSPADLALASTWLSHRDAKDWASLNLAGLSTAKIIDKWLVPHQATSSVDHVAEIRRVIRRLVQATDKSAAVQAWSTETVRFSRLSQSGIIPPSGCEKSKGDDGRRLATSQNDAGNFVGAPSHGRRRTNDPEFPIRRRHTTVEIPWDSGLSRRFTVIDHTARAYAGRGLIRHRQGAHRSSIGGWSVFFARTPPQSWEKLNGSLWAWNARR